MGIKLKSASRQAGIVGAFVGYHGIKFILWRFGYFANFFYRTRFLSFPILGAALYYSVKSTMN